MKQNHLAYLFFPTGYVFFSIFDNRLILTQKPDEINLLLLFSNPVRRRQNMEESVSKPAWVLHKTFLSHIRIKHSKTRRKRSKFGKHISTANNVTPPCQY